MSILFHSRVVPFVKQLQLIVFAWLLLLISSWSAQAQVYPVIVNTNLRAPYSLNLSDYAAPGFDRVITNLYMADLTKVNYPVTLRLTIRGEGGVNLTTLPGQEIGPIYLNGGQTTTLTGAEVNGLFNPDKLQFSGISIQQYRQNSALPEGLYQFQFEVIDYNLGVPISNANAGFATAWLILNDPPLINQPDNDVTIAPLPQQNIFFQWTPRHTGSPNAAFTTVYDLQLVEIYPSTRNANDAMLTSPIIFEKTLYSTSYNYTLADPYLFPGKWYAFRVRAHDTDGRDFFKNQGYSEVYRFYYGSPCVVPALINVSEIDPTSALVSWDRDVTYNTTELQYKEKTASNWKKIISYSNSEIVDKLTPRTEYVFRLKGSCANNDSPFSTDIAYTSGSVGGEACDLPLTETVTATAVTLSDVNVSWLTESWFTSYVFRYRPLGALTFQEVTTTTPSAIIRLLDLHTIYEYQIRYLCTTGEWVEGAYNTFRVTVPPDVLNGGGTGDCFPPLDIAQEVKEDLTVFISWPRERDAKAYMVYWKEDVAATSWLSAETSSPKITLSDLKPATDYIYEIKSICKNGGWSIASKQGKFTTTYVAPVNTPCSAPVLKPVVILAADQVKLSWEVDPAHTGYVVEYRVVGDQFWVASRETNAYKGLTGLDRTKKYEYRVYGFCGLKSSDFSPVVEFSTNGVPAAPFVCGSMQNPLNIINRNPIPSLKVGDKFTAAQFEMEVKALTSGAPYNGEASAKVPYLKNSSFIFGMQNVMVNELGEMYSGRIYMKKTNLSILDPAVSAQIKDILDKVDQGFTTLDGYLTAVNQLQNDVNTYISQAEGGNNVGKVVTGEVTATNTVTVAITNPSQITGSAAGAGKCNLSITGDDGTKQTLAVEAPSTLRDSKGNIYAISASCSATKVAETITPVPTGLNELSNKAVVTFHTVNDAKFGFSAWNTEYAKSPEEWGKRYEALAGNYRVSSKFMEPASTDIIKATIATTDASVDKSKIIFVTGKGVKFASTQSGNDYQITIVGGPEKDAQEIYALYPNGAGTYLSFGKLLVPAYKHKKRTMVLVPVNGATADQDKIASRLNKIYNPYGVEWEVRTDANFVCDYDKNEIDGLAVEGSGAFSTLTEEMAALNKAYIDAPRTIDPTNIYLFVLNKSETAGVAGDMPRAKQFGYLFTDNNSAEEVASTAAHEAGHGLFLLRHVFDGYDMTEGRLPDNLMDYPLGDQLAKLQWDVMHDPGIVLGVFDKDDDAKSLIVQDIAKLIPFLNSDKKSYSFIAPSGKQISIPYDIKQIVFYSNDESTVYKNTKSFFFPDGALRGFTLANGDIYSAKCDETNTTMFDGYVKSGTSSFYTDNFSVSLNIEDNRKAIVGLLCVNNGDLIFKTRRLNYNGVAIPASSNASGTYVATLPVDGPNYFQWDQNTSNVQSIDLKYVTTKPYGKAAKDFLDANSTCDSRYPKYVLTLANFLDEFGDYSKSCVGLTGDFISNFAINPACTSCVSKPTTITEAAYKAKVDNFIAIVKQFKVFQDKIINVTSAEAMRTLFSQNITCTYGMLTAEQRAHAVKVLSDESLYSCDGVLLNNCGEEYVMDLFYSTPTEQRKSFLDQLNAKNATGKLFRFATNGLGVEGVDGAEAASLANMLFNWMEELNYNKPSYDAAFVKERVLNLYPYVGSGVFGGTCSECYYAKSDFSSDNREICFCLPDKPGEIPCPNTCTDPRKISLPWNEWIIVRPMEDITDLGLRKHQVALIPAIYLHWYICNKRGEYVTKTIRTGFDVITIMSGAGTIVNGASKVVTAVTIAEMVVATADIAIINTDKAVLASVLGPEFSDNWDYFYTYFGLGVGARYISPLIYNKALALHNKLQTINWTQLNGRISDASKRSLTKMKTSLEKVFPALNQGNMTRLVKDVIVKKVVATVKNYTKYNNVALGKDQSGKLKAFGDEVGANVYTRETDKMFTTIYDLPDYRSFERNMTSVFNETVGANQGKILFDLTGVNVEKAIAGGMIHNPELVLKGWITELELQMLLRNKSWYDNVIFHEAGVIKSQEELTSYGIKYLGQ